MCGLVLKKMWALGYILGLIRDHISIPTLKVEGIKVVSDLVYSPPLLSYGRFVVLSVVYVLVVKMAKYPYLDSFALGPHR